MVTTNLLNVYGGGVEVDRSPDRACVRVPNNRVGTG
jgi:hypothetical protein